MDADAGADADADADAVAGGSFSALTHVLLHLLLLLITQKKSNGPKTNDNNLVMSYGDARTHLNKIRKVIEALLVWWKDLIIS